MTRDRPRRRFSVRERVALFLASNGRCTECGTHLTPEWEADHVIPWSLNGATDVANGQALCAPCNRSKGNRMTNLRAWQREVWERYLALGRPQDFLVVATPGAGKTRLALHVADRLLKAGAIDRIVIVCPTVHLKRQWAKAAQLAGLKITGEFKNKHGALAADVHGTVTTYQQVAEQPLLHRTLVARQRTLVILDECHHAGDESCWGEAIREAYEPAVHRLSLSGTPFRTDGTPIPFVNYGPADADGLSSVLPDFTYTHRQALYDKICNPVFFPRIGGRMEWSSNETVFDATFEDELSERRTRERLNTALRRKEFLTVLLSEAHANLTKLRSTDPDAGGLVVAIDAEHAEDIATLMRSALGIEPTVALYNKPDASQRITDFARGSAPWLVAVRMVSEGVDIPRLRQLVYATNVTTDLHFRQAVGRIVRVEPNNKSATTPDSDRSGSGLDQHAFCNIPDDPRLRKLAQQMINERMLALQDESKQPPGNGPGDPSDKSRSGFEPLSAEAAFAGMTHNGDVVTAPEYQQATLALQTIGESDDPRTTMLVAKVLRLGPMHVPTPPPSDRTIDERKKDLKTKQNRQVGHYCSASGVPFHVVNGTLNRKVGIASVETATEAQLAARWELVKQLLDGTWKPDF